MSLHDFAQAMRQLDLSSVPADRKLDAIKDHLARIQENELEDQAQRVVLRSARKMKESRLT